MKVKYGSQFKKDIKKVRKNSKRNKVFNKPLHFSDLSPWEYIIRKFIDDEPIPDYFYAHPITLSRKDIQNIRSAIGKDMDIKAMDLHFDGRTGDCLLLYATNKEYVYLLRIGSHSELF